MTLRNLSFLIVGLILLSGCATQKPRESRLNDAFSVVRYSAIRLQEGTYRISFYGKNVTTSASAADFARLRSAEIALRDGYQYFFINKYFVTSDKAPVNGERAAADTLAMNTLIIQCFQKRPVNAPSAVYNAAGVSRIIRSKYKIK